MKLLVTSAKGAPGVTTLAFGLAAGLADSSITYLIEADPAGGSLTADLGLAPGKGLLDLAADHEADLIERGTRITPLMRLLGGPPSRKQAEAALRSGGHRLQALDGHLVIDVGHAPDLLPGGGLELDMVVHVVRPVVSELAALLSLWRERGMASNEVAALIEGSKKAAGATPYNEALSLLRAHTTTFEVPWDRNGVRLMHEAPDGRRWTTKPFGLAIAGILDSLAVRSVGAGATW